MKSLISLLVAFCLLMVGMEVSRAQLTARLMPASSPNYRMYPDEKPPLLPMPCDIKWADKATQLTEVSPVFPKKTTYPEQMDFIRREVKSFLDDHMLKVGKGYVIKFEISSDNGLAENEESYKLVATDKGVLIKAASTKGLFYGWKTLQQLIIRRDGKTTIAQVEITDTPKFPIRGFMNDTGRNYMDISLIKEEIDSMAQYKLNVYHFHFTDNYGWRLESKKYPQLQSPASFERKPGKYYTQKQFIEFVEYCRLRNITVIPEMDMPGHTKSFRKALNIEKMDDPKVTKILTDLIKELASLVPAEKMPYIHIGTDETHGNEVVSKETLNQYFEAVHSEGRRALRWQPGLHPGTEQKPIEQLWTGRTRSKPSSPESEYIDSLENYLNHLDPFESIMTMYFKKNCVALQGKGMGGILCSWPDLYMEKERAHLNQTPVFSSIAAYSEALWSDPREEDELIYYSNLPLQGDKKLEGFREFEDRLVAHRDRFFRNKEFPYVRQANIPWKLIGPFPNENNGSTVFPVEEEIKASYEVGGQTYEWSKDTYTGATIIFKHYCDYPTLVSPDFGKMSNPQSTYYATTFVHSPKNQEVPFWISGHHWPNSDFRTGAIGVPGKWFHSDPKFYVNGEVIEPPAWTYPNRNTGAMIPLVDENYIFREPTKVKLKKGWNRLLVKSPHNNATRRWMFTFVPVAYDNKKPGCNIMEYPGLTFAVGLKDGVPAPLPEKEEK